MLTTKQDNAEVTNPTSDPFLDKTNLTKQALANKLWLKTADLVALEGKDYYKAIEIYEKVAKSSISNNLMRWSVKEYLLKAGICQLCTGDQVGVNTALERYRELDPSFVQQREHQLLTDLATAVQEGDQEMFADKVYEMKIPLRMGWANSYSCTNTIS
jgi:alpha-soluble NSF attachment protein